MQKALHSILDDMGQNIEVCYDLTFKDLTTIKVGGPIAATLFIRDRDCLVKLLQRLEQHPIPWLVLGKGSNVIAPDEGFQGMVMILSGEMTSIERDGTKIKAGAGASIKRLMNSALRWGLAGLEFLVGIPGSVGGAVRMNSGAFGREIKDVVAEIELASSKGIQIWDPEKMGFKYRASSIPKGAVIVSATFLCEPAPKPKIMGKMKEFLEKRFGSQPSRWPSMGSVFKNPPGDYAGRLIEASGLKGKRMGGAFVSQKHANFILNDGTATAKDIMSLIRHIQEKVREKTGISLELEVCCIE